MSHTRKHDGICLSVHGENVAGISGLGEAPALREYRQKTLHALNRIFLDLRLRTGVEGGIAALRTGENNLSDLRKGLVPAFIAMQITHPWRITS